MKTMRKYSADELYEILKSHANWLHDGTGICADLSYTILRRADLHGVDLRGANLSYADLKGANLHDANLENAILNHADLEGANLECALLHRAYLEWAVLNRTNLKGTILTNAMMWCASFDRAWFASDTCINWPLSCPDEGAFIGWKKCFAVKPMEFYIGRTALSTALSVIVKLRILDGSKRSSATSRTCRCDRAEVLDIQDLFGNSLDGIVAHSRFNEDFTYTVGKIVSVDDFDECRWHECAPGIHFFITKQEAIDYLDI